jgi:hypothetical protein
MAYLGWLFFSRSALLNIAICFGLLNYDARPYGLLGLAFFSRLALLNFAICFGLVLFFVFFGGVLRKGLMGFIIGV